MDTVPDDVVEFILEHENDDDTDWRFGNESEHAINILKEHHISRNTSRKIIYVLKLWNDWVQEKNAKLRLSTTCVPQSSFETLTIEEINKWVPYFLAEIRTKDKQEYKANSYLEFVLCLQLHCLIHGKSYKFLKDDCFKNVRNSLDGVMKMRQKQGLGCNPNKAEIVTKEQEDFMWSNGILGEILVFFAI